MTLTHERLLGILEGTITEFTDEELLEAEKRNMEIIPGHEVSLYPGKKKKKTSPPLRVYPTHADITHKKLGLED